MPRKPTTPRKLILVLGDQLSPQISSLTAGNAATDVVLLVEVVEEATYVRHHKKKIALIFSAMRHFRDELRDRGWTVDYVTLDDPDNTGTFGGEVERAIARYGAQRVLVTEPGEWRVLDAMERWAVQFSLPVDIWPDTRFIASRTEFTAWAADRKQIRMEYFYREMRQKTRLLMDGAGPQGGRWNFDAENREPPRSDGRFPVPPRFQPDAITQEVLDLVARRFGDHFGDLEPFWFGTTREAAEIALDHFLAEALPRFGPQQDAMLSDERFLNHAVISIYLNCGLLDPLDICQRAEAEYRAGRVPLQSDEGFIRQILGWREYVRRIYWLRMPEYAKQNFFRNTRRLPAFYWTGKTDMNCLNQAIRQTKEEAYAHHIQRLMVTGNFALLAGIDPADVCEWYLIVYADAYEWVELPNTLGMSLFGDGGLLGSKPYAASGNYINRMSDYCGGCRFDVKQKSGPNACPFNYLYWDFLVRNQQQLSRNQRLVQVYRNWQRMDEGKQREIRSSAKDFLDALVPWPGYDEVRAAPVGQATDVAIVQPTLSAP